MSYLLISRKKKGISFLLFPLRLWLCCFKRENTKTRSFSILFSYFPRRIHFFFFFCSRLFCVEKLVRPMENMCLYSSSYWKTNEKARGIPIICKYSRTLHPTLLSLSETLERKKEKERKKGKERKKERKQNPLDIRKSPHLFLFSRLLSFCFVRVCTTNCCMFFFVF